MAVIELVDNYESGRGTVKNKYRTAKRVLLVSPYESWMTDPDVPVYGDAYPGDADLRVVQIDFEGAGGLDPAAAGPMKYEYAKLTVHYSTYTGNDTLSRYEISGELLEVGGYGTFAGSGNPIERPMTIPVNIIDYYLPRRVNPIPMSTILGLMNCVNDAAWSPEGYIFAAETVLFCGAPCSYTWDPEVGMFLYNVEYHFKINPLGWNTAWDGVAGGWDTVLPKRFTPANFTGFPP